MSAPAAELDRWVSLADIPGGGLSLRVEASPAECAALARRYQVEAVEGLRAELRLKPLSGGRYRLTGHVQARVRQLCVVSLEPVENDVGEDIDVVFASGRGVPADADEVEIDALGEDPPEPLVDGRIPVGETVAQYAALAIDPFPRAAGAALERTSAGDDEPEPPRDSPFAVLRKLR